MAALMEVASSWQVLLSCRNLSFQGHSCSLKHQGPLSIPRQRTEICSRLTSRTFIHCSWVQPQLIMSATQMNSFYAAWARPLSPLRLVPTQPHPNSVLPCWLQLPPQCHHSATTSHPEPVVCVWCTG